MTNTKAQVALTILEQLGGSRFTAMTGATNFLAHPKALSFKVPNAAKKITHVEITLNPNDTYLVEFLNCRITRKRYIRDRVEARDNVYFDQLQEIFTEVTGLYTHL